MFGIDCITYCAQTGVIANRPAEVNNFYEYYIEKSKLGTVKFIAERAPNPSDADLVWLANNDVRHTRARFNIIGPRQIYGTKPRS